MTKDIISLIPESVSTYDIYNGKFSIIIPEETTNLLPNPSFEITNIHVDGRYGYTAFPSSQIDISDAESTHGFYSLKCTTTGDIQNGAYVSVRLTVDTPYTFSVDIKGVVGLNYTISFADVALADIQSFTFMSTGEWERVYVTYTPDVTGDFLVTVYENAITADTHVFYVDSLQLEAKDHPTTYCDGDLYGLVPGEVSYWWMGEPHMSTSYRSPDTRAGGRRLSFEDAGLKILAVQGLGYTPVSVQIDPATTGGAYFKNSVPGIPEVTFACHLYGNSVTNLASLLRIRRELLPLFRSDTTASSQPLVIQYHKNPSVANYFRRGYSVYCVYKSGLEGMWDTGVDETILLAFTQYKPYIEDEYETSHPVDGNNLVQTVNLGSNLALNDSFETAGAGTPDVFDDWSETISAGEGNVTDETTVVHLGAHSAKLTAIKAIPNTYIYQIVTVVPGVTYNWNIWSYGDGANIGNITFSDVSHSYYPLFIIETPIDEAWHNNQYSFTASDGCTQVALILMPPNVAGGFVYYDDFFIGETTGGVNHGNIVKYDTALNTWSQVTDGSYASTATDFIRGIRVSPLDGNLYAFGVFDQIGAVACKNIAMWDGSWHAVGNSNNPADIHDLAIDIAGKVYIVGIFASITGPGTVNNIAMWDGAWNALSTGLNTTSAEFATLSGNAIVYNLGTNNIYVGGEFVKAGAVTCNGVAKWNGATWSAMGTGGVHTDASHTTLKVNAMSWATVSSVGYLFVGGYFAEGNGLAIFESIGDAEVDVVGDLIGNPTVYSISNGVYDDGYWKVVLHGLGLGGGGSIVSPTCVRYNLSMTDGYPLPALVGQAKTYTKFEKLGNTLYTTNQSVVADVAYLSDGRIWLPYVGLRGETSDAPIIEYDPLSKEWRHPNFWLPVFDSGDNGTPTTQCAIYNIDSISVSEDGNDIYIAYRTRSYSDVYPLPYMLYEASTIIDVDGDVPPSKLRIGMSANREGAFYYYVENVTTDERLEFTRFNVNDMDLIVESHEESETYIRDSYNGIPYGCNIKAGRNLKIMHGENIIKALCSLVNSNFLPLHISYRIRYNSIASIS